jgi:hypothetical protein
MTVMTWRIRSAVIALALFVLGTTGAGVTSAPTFASGAAASGPTAGTPADTSYLDPFGLAAVIDGANPSAAPGAGTGNAFTGEDSAGDEDPGAGGDGATPRDRSFTAVFDEDQDFSERSFLAPPTTGPPAA